MTEAGTCSNRPSPDGELCNRPAPSHLVCYKCLHMSSAAQLTVVGIVTIWNLDHTWDSNLNSKNNWAFATALIYYKAERSYSDLCFHFQCEILILLQRSLWVQGCHQRNEKHEEKRDLKIWAIREQNSCKLCRQLLTRKMHSLPRGRQFTVFFSSCSGKLGAAVAVVLAVVVVAVVSILMFSFYLNVKVLRSPVIPFIQAHMIFFHTPSTSLA